ncbi:MAG: hypothetical protein QME79_05410 [Bacillota bacterium]|nr:hypothetical protein [Bacillota bacterium]
MKPIVLLNSIPAQGETPVELLQSKVFRVVARAGIRAGLRSGALDVAFLLDRPVASPDLVAEALRLEPMALGAA